METKFYQTSRPAVTRESVEKVIDQYFGQADYECVIQMRGQRPVVEITYEDFKPTSVVRAELTKLIPNIELQKLERDYSLSAMHDAADEIIAGDEKLFYVVVPGSEEMQAVSLWDVIDSMLYYRTITKTA